MRGFSRDVSTFGASRLEEKSPRVGACLLRESAAFMWRAAWAIGLAVLAPSASRAQCDIQGEHVVHEHESFVLCGPDGPEFGYRWSGPGAATFVSRCITVPGRSAGMYEYTLCVVRSGVECGECRFVVTVEGEGGTAHAWIGPRSARPPDQASASIPRASVAASRPTTRVHSHRAPTGTARRVETR
jgi:hypothetical protein